MSKRIYRKDYTESNYLIKNTHLLFEIYEEWTLVTSTVAYYQNPQNSPQQNLILNGEHLELVDISLNGKIPEYTQGDESLEILNTPREFSLQITTKIYPQHNTALSGLYLSKSAFCTQCEAHGFRRITYFLDRPDVLSTWTVEINTYKEFSALLSNGDLVKQTSTYAKWHDPYPKPCYLFALVVGDLVRNSGTFITREGREVGLNIWCEKHNIDKTDFALTSLKNAMKWDEERFRLSYDLAIYNIVAVDDFNMGAMENKGLNVFNSKFVLASPHTATDEDYLNIEAVIGHEYFHNWTGNRITCRDWFQLSLKEGLTVFRDQEFSADMRLRTFKRIADVRYLQTYQFLEDNSSLAHPVRPESYVVMDNFYTLTVYEKGAEIVRMLHTLLGEEKFMQGFDNYIHNFDGQAVTIEDFVKTLLQRSAISFDKFMLWYSTFGVNTVEIISNDTTLTITQNDDRITPLKYAVINAKGECIAEDMLVLAAKSTPFDISQYRDCLISWNRDFSAPVELINHYSNAEKAHLVRYDTNAYVRYEYMQELYIAFIFAGDDTYLQVLDTIIATENDNATLSVLLEIPDEKLLYNHTDCIDPLAIFHKREELITSIAERYKTHFIKEYTKLHTSEYRFDNIAIVERKLKNQYLEFICYSAHYELAYQQYREDNCATDEIASFTLLLHSPYKEEVVRHFYDIYHNDELMMNKWFSAIAADKTTTVVEVQQLLTHPLFHIDNPNNVRSVLGGWARNYMNFHTAEGYCVLADAIVQLNTINPQIGARLVSHFAHYQKFDTHYQKLQLECILAIKNTTNLSADIKEIIEKILIS